MKKIVKVVNFVMVEGLELLWPCIGPQAGKTDTIKFATLGANASAIISNLRPICNSQMLKVGPKFVLASTPSVKRALLLLLLLLLVCKLL